ncbi:MAG: WG repeat-containing protein, partial [Thermoleophilia bacterium]|nr:WG repeat-containing protein [Thermoleophilia bacterium]
MTIRRLIVVVSTVLCCWAFAAAGCDLSDGDVTTLPSVVTEVSPTAETAGLYPVLVAGRCGYMDSAGKIKIAPGSLPGVGGYGFFDGMAVVEYWENSGAVRRRGYIDTSGSAVGGLQFNYACDFSGGLAAVADDVDSWGYLDKTGTLAIPMQYEVALPFREGLGLVKDTDGWVFIDARGARVLGPCDKAFCFSEGLAYVEGQG